MACPIAAGCCALVRQHMEQNRNHIPSAALVKALMINGAQDVGLGVPNDDQGWGKIDLTETIKPGGSDVQFIDDPAHAVASLQEKEYRANVADPSLPVVVTMVWRDFSGASIQNKLHLRVFDGDELVANSSDSEFDIRNNVQKVVIENVANPFVRIEVEGINVSQGIPEGQDVVQDFALAVGNVSDLELVN